MRSSGFFVALVASLVRAAPQGGNGSIDASSGNHYVSRGEVMEDFWVNPADPGSLIAWSPFLLIHPHICDRNAIPLEMAKQGKSRLLILGLLYR